MGSFQKTRQLRGRNHRHIFRTAAADNHDFAVVSHLVQQGREICPRGRVGGLDCHSSSPPSRLYSNTVQLAARGVKLSSVRTLGYAGRKCEQGVKPDLEEVAEQSPASR